MPTFEIPNAYIASPLSGRYHVHELLSSGDVDGNTYRNLLYVGQLILLADDDNTTNLFIGNKHVTPDNHDAELLSSDSVNYSMGGPMDKYICYAPIEAAPGAPTVANGAAGTNLLEAGVYKWKITFVTPEGETQAGTASAPLTVDPAAELPPALSAIPTSVVAGTTVTARNVYRTEVGGTVYKLSGTIADNTTTTYTDNVPDEDLEGAAPAVNSATPQRVNISWDTESFIEE